MVVSGVFLVKKTTFQIIFEQIVFESANILSKSQLVKP